MVGPEGHETAAGTVHDGIVEMVYIGCAGATVASGGSVYAVYRGRGGS